MLNHRRRRVRFLLLGLLLLAIVFGAIGVAVHRARRTMADVTVTKVTQNSNPDELVISFEAKLRGKSTGSWVINDNGKVKVMPVMIRNSGDLSLLDWYLRPASISLGTTFVFGLNPGEDFKVHMPPSKSRWVQTGEDLVLVSSSREGVPVRSIALRFEPTAH